MDAMFSARAIAQRYREEPTVRGLCQNVVAVAGLVAETGATLTQAEYQVLAELAAVGKQELDRSLLSVDRFLRAERSLPERADHTEQSLPERADNTERSLPERADNTARSLPERADN